MKYINRYESPVGMIILESDGKNLTGLRFEIQSRVCDVTHGVECAVKELSVFEQTERWLDIYFSGRDPGFTPPLKVAGSNFQRMICDIMLTIPYGNTTTYGRIANRVKEKNGKDGDVCSSCGRRRRAQSYFCYNSMPPRSGNRREPYRLWWRDGQKGVPA